MPRETFEVGTDINSIEVHIHSDNDVEKLQEKMNAISYQTAQEFYKLKSQSLRVNELLEKNFNRCHLSEHFDIHELVEEQIDDFIHEYSKIKEYLKHGRYIRHYIEKNRQQKSNEYN